jgi:hypothetical protein
MALSGKEVREAKPGTYQDSESLLLIVNAKGQRQWIFKYKIGKKIDEIELEKNLSLAKARINARRWQSLVDNGKNPKEMIERQKEEMRRISKEQDKVIIPFFLFVALGIFSLFWFYDPIDYISEMLPPMHSSPRHYPANWSVEERMRYDNLPAWEKTAVDQRLREREALCSASKEC